MSPLISVILRYTANTSMALGLLVTVLASWDYWRGPAAGEAGTLVGVGVGMLVFWVGFGVFRKMARDIAAQDSEH